jgi:uncharacterized protein YndB with AHSA1/START domain
MSARPQVGTLVLADISGFTAFLARSELEHAHDVLLELLQLVVARLQPKLTIAEIEGDAVFAYAPAGALVRGEDLLDLIDRTYAVFLGRVEAIRVHTTCTCTACNSIPILDLKFIVHHGEYILQAVAGPAKPLGSAVNLAHRLLKNHVAEATGWQAYASLTETVVQQLGIPTGGMVESVETYAEFEPLRIFSFDLRARWQAARRRQQIAVQQGESDWEVTLDLPARPEVVWEWLNDPQRRSRWVGLAFDRLTPSNHDGVGTRTHCTHGSKVESLHTILDWQPYDYFTEEIANPRDGAPQALLTVTLEPNETGTHACARYRVLVKPRFISVPLFRLTSTPEIRASLKTLQGLLSQDDAST